MRVYQAADGRWIFWTGSEKLYYDTEREARKAMAKIDTAKAVVAQVQQLATPMDGAPDIFQEYWDIVNSGGAFTNEDVAPLGITAAQLVDCITVIEAFNTLMAAHHAEIGRASCRERV